MPVLTVIGFFTIPKSSLDGHMGIVANSIIAWGVIMGIA